MIHDHQHPAAAEDDIKHEITQKQLNKSTVAGSQRETRRDMLSSIGSTMKEDYHCRVQAHLEFAVLIWE
jgi:hypothetical protein